MSFSQKVKEDLLKKANDDLIADKLQIEAMLRFGGEVLISKPMNQALKYIIIVIIKKILKILIIIKN